MILVLISNILIRLADRSSFFAFCGFMDVRNPENEKYEPNFANPETDSADPIYECKITPSGKGPVCLIMKIKTLFLLPDR